MPTPPSPKGGPANPSSGPSKTTVGVAGLFVGMGLGGLIALALVGVTMMVGMFWFANMLSGLEFEEAEWEEEEWDERIELRLGAAELLGVEPTSAQRLLA